MDWVFNANAVVQRLPVPKTGCNKQGEVLTMNTQERTNMQNPTATHNAYRENTKELLVTPNRKEKIISNRPGKTGGSSCKTPRGKFVAVAFSSAG
ncbi:hypothetical protein Pyn_15054 [Prunus yedoensis var. nudiflora]|uniref:Uncharacterized protein n=1 Tax=Prunus yedoensis var. nudiflora TaxID=2094558 RepID=A0A314ZXB3_PRUYE|nr:hypothetical protein Pyn_15054 [Prunus yedoensis var. nudiflora]